MQSENIYGLHNAHVWMQRVFSFKKSSLPRWAPVWIQLYYTATNLTRFTQSHLEVPDAWSFHVRTPSQFQYMGDWMVLLGPRSWRVNLNLQWGCFDSWANYQLSALLKAKKARQVEISLLITARGGSIKGADGSNWWLIASTLAVADAAPVNLVTTPTKLNFKGIIGSFIVAT